LRYLHRLAAALLLSAFPGLAFADHIDPYEVAEQAATAFKNGGSYAEARAMFSQALREAAHDGKLDQGFAIVYAMYSDLTRYDGNPAFALQLADEGIALVQSAPQPDEQMKNALMVSRAYALADLGQYQQAVDAVAITAIWMGERFGEKSRTDLEAMARGWAEQAAAAGLSVALPSAVQLAVDLAAKAEEAFNAQDTQTAITLASRAMLPEGTGLSKPEMDYHNARTQMIVGAAYSFEGRHQPALVALRRAADLLSVGAWDGKAKAELRPEVRNSSATDAVAWSTFSFLASAAGDAGDWPLAQAALDTAAEFATTPERRFSLLSQQAGAAFASKDYGKAEATFRRGEVDALAAGDATNAALARLYIAVARLAGSDGKPEGTADDELLQAAAAGADAVGEDLQMAEYMLTTAVRMVADKTGAYTDAMPAARRAFEVFKQRQKQIAGYEAAQESSRRERRRFLEIFIAGAYEEAAVPAKP
jgi:tetratricopeptide (TPR) repeat protein